MHRRESAILFQTMGRRSEETGGADSRRTYVGRNAAAEHVRPNTTTVKPWPECASKVSTNFNNVGEPKNIRKTHMQKVKRSTSRKQKSRRSKVSERRIATAQVPLQQPVKEERMTPQEHTEMLWEQFGPSSRCDED